MSEQGTPYFPTDEPRSRAQADLGGGVYTLYQTGSVGIPKPPRVPSQREQLQNAARAETQSNRHKSEPMMPTYDDLSQMTPEQKTTNLEHIRAIRDGRPVVAEQVEVEQLTLEV